ncbi:leukotriene A-4 hydrolase-like [Culicoides brevitarsis]|uniref:leukotriene A-4 hydrolase-like n=1 Tax=Culicoides brevitarsis TaxID=469753 RepID=UPI00307C5975
MTVTASTKKSSGCDKLTLTTFVILLGIALWLQFKTDVAKTNSPKMGRMGKVDPNSYAEPEKVVMQHADLDWEIDFNRKIISGSVTLKFNVLSDDGIEHILLDVSDLKIESVFAKLPAGEIPLTFTVTDPVENVGSKLTVNLPNVTKGVISIVIDYDTVSASALAWLSPEQTSGKKHPYVFSQCQAIHARSILPCQDTPAVKFTYSAVVKHPSALIALMSAIRDEAKSTAGVSRFTQTVPIPSYLMALAVGPLVSRQIGPISKVWSEQEQIEEAAYEFVDTDNFVQKASEICGPYVWKEYNLLVLPKSFPFGGMENPTLTFVTPTIIAKDRSLVDVVAHEIAHSWTGNLVTNKNFEHFWLNEGFTVFVEGKILGRIHGAAYRDFHALHGLTDLADCIKNQLADEPQLTKLVVNLTDLSPDDAFSSVPYMKGSNFLRYIEDLVGGPDVFEPFLKFYLDKFKYQSIETQDFKKTLYDYFNEKGLAALLEPIDWEAWLYGEGMPPVIPKYDTSLVDACREHTNLWADNALDVIKNSKVITGKLSSSQVVEFLGGLLEKENIVELNADKIAFLAETYGLEKTQNAEIRFRYVRLMIRARLRDRMSEILSFANSNFRMKFVRPVYKDLGKWPEVRDEAIANFQRVRNEMMKVCALQVAKDLGLNE